MEKRFVAFLLSSFFVLAIYLGIQVMFPPDPRDLPPADRDDVAVVDGGETDADADAAGAGAEASPDGSVTKPPGDGETGEDEPAVGEPPGDSPEAGGSRGPANVPEGGMAEGGGAEGGGGEVLELPTEDSSQLVTIGSMDPLDRFRALVTFTSRGAGVWRFELTSREKDGKRLRYHNLEHRHGYLGHLALEELPGGAGVRVRVVGRGTPAALAQPAQEGAPVGLQVGDVIEQIDGMPIADRSDYVRRMADTEPGSVLKLVILREGSEQPRSLEYTVVLSEEPLELIGPDNVVPGDQHIPSLLLWLSTVEKQSWKDPSQQPLALQLLREGNWEATRAEDGGAVEFRMRLAAAQLQGTGLEGDWEFVKRYRLAQVPVEQITNPDYPAYHLDCEFEIINRSDVPQQVAYRLGGPNSLPLEGWWYSNKIHPQLFKSAGARDVIWKPAGYRNQQLKGASQIHSYAEDNPNAPGMPLIDTGNPTPLEYIGVDTQYFTSALLPSETPLPGPDAAAAEGPEWLKFRQAEAVAMGDFRSLDKKAVRTTNSSVLLTSSVQQVDPGTPLTKRFVLFAGPKRSELLHEYGLGSAIEFGWFAMVARPLSSLLHFFYWIVGNYGIAIILLTVIVRSCMFPISRKAARNAQKMQELAPERKKLSEKYKNDMEKRAQKQKELFAKHNYNPAGGCLLMFLQLPVFIGLYRSLSVDIELRQAPLIPGLDWCSNLAGPDQLWRWDWLLPDWIAGTTGWLGPYLNILPIITVALFMVQQKLFTPPPTDEQTRMQHQVMKFMMLFMGVLFFKVPAGLCLYFISSSIWGICERLLLPKPTPPQADASAKPEPRGAAGGGGVSSREAAAARRAKPTASGDSNGASRKERAKRRQRKR